MFQLFLLLKFCMHVCIPSVGASQQVVGLLPFAGCALDNHHQFSNFSTWRTAVSPPSDTVPMSHAATVTVAVRSPDC